MKDFFFSFPNNLKKSCAMHKKITTEFQFLSRCTIAVFEYVPKFGAKLVLCLNWFCIRGHITNKFSKISQISKRHQQEEERCIPKVEEADSDSGSAIFFFFFYGKVLQYLRSNHTNIMLSTCSQVQRYKSLELKEKEEKKNDGLLYSNFSCSNQIEKKSCV